MEKGGLPALPGPAGQVASWAVLGAPTPAAQGCGFQVGAACLRRHTCQAKQRLHVPGIQVASLRGTSKEVGLRQGLEGSSSPGRMTEEASKHCTCPRASSGPPG